MGNTVKFFTQVKKDNKKKGYLLSKRYYLLPCILRIKIIGSQRSVRIAPPSLLLITTVQQRLLTLLSLSPWWQTGAFRHQNLSKVFSELKLVTDNLSLYSCSSQLRSHWKKTRKTSKHFSWVVFPWFCWPLRKEILVCSLRLVHVTQQLRDCDNRWLFQLWKTSPTCDWYIEKAC